MTIKRAPAFSWVVLRGDVIHDSHREPRVTSLSLLLPMREPPAEFIYCLFLKTFMSSKLSLWNHQAWHYAWLVRWVLLNGSLQEAKMGLYPRMHFGIRAGSWWLQARQLPKKLLRILSPCQIGNKPFFSSCFRPSPKTQGLSHCISSWSCLRH